MNNVRSRVRRVCLDYWPRVILYACQVPAVTLLDATHAIFSASSVCGDHCIHLMHMRRYALTDNSGETLLGAWSEL